MSVDVEASQARGAGVDPDDPPLRWEVSAGDDAVGWSARCSPTSRAASTSAAARSSCSCRRRSAVQMLGGKRLHWLRCRIDELTASGETRRELHPGARDLLDHRRPDRRPAARVARRAGRAREPRDERRHPRPVLPACAMSPVLPLEPGETLEVQEPGDATWVRVGGARDVRRQPRHRPPLHDRLRVGRGRLRARRSARRTRAGRQYGAVPPKGARLRISGYRHGGGRAGNVASGTLTMLKSSLAGIETVVNPRAGHRRASTRSRCRAARQRAAMDIRSRYRAVTGEDYEFLSRRGVAARGPRAVRPARGGRRRARAPAAPRRPGRPPARGPRADPGRGAVRHGRRLPRRAPHDRHDGPAAAGQAARRERRGQPPGRAQRRPAARRGGRRPRALHLRQPADRRLARRARATAGRSGARSTRASCTASSTRSRASSS